MALLSRRSMLAAGVALAFAGAPALAQPRSPWPVIEADPGLVEQIRHGISPFYPLGPHDLTVIPPVEEAARRAAWLDERYGWWLEIAGRFATSWTQIVERRPAVSNTPRRAPDPELDAALAKELADERAKVDGLKSVIPLAEAARAAVREAEHVRLEAAAGRASEAAVREAAARRDAAETAFFEAERSWGITGDARYKAVRGGWNPLGPKVRIAAAAFERDELRRRIEADLEAARPAMDPALFAQAQARAAEILAAANKRYALRVAYQEASAKETALSSSPLMYRAQSESIAFRLVRDAVERGRLPAAALAEATARLKAAQEAFWDHEEAFHEARVAAQAAQTADWDFRDGNPALQYAFSNWLAQARAAAAPVPPAVRAAAQARLDQALADYEELRRSPGMSPEALAGFYKRVEAARAEVENGGRPVFNRPLPSPVLAQNRTLARPAFLDRPIPRRTRPAVLPVLPGPGLGVQPPNFASQQAASTPGGSGNQSQ